mmetsp:Transcript_38688/g.58861  ORF Transcript_38688/g.58861 Transcript_38688/m.58861 type:complete len:302 (+) Transcript_38688:562-1467(+)
MTRARSISFLLRLLSLRNLSNFAAFQDLVDNPLERLATLDDLHQQLSLEVSMVVGHVLFELLVPSASPYQHEIALQFAVYFHSAYQVQRASYVQDWDRNLQFFHHAGDIFIHRASLPRLESDWSFFKEVIAMLIYFSLSHPEKVWITESAGARVDIGQHHGGLKLIFFRYLDESLFFFVFGVGLLDKLSLLKLEQPLKLFLFPLLDRPFLFELFGLSEHLFLSLLFGNTPLLVRLFFLVLQLELLFNVELLLLLQLSQSFFFSQSLRFLELSCFPLSLGFFFFSLLAGFLFQFAKAASLLF